jgi:hypothetical protein
LGIDSDNDFTAALLEKRLALTRGDRQASLRVHVDVLHTTEHSAASPLLRLFPQIARKTHISPLIDTIGARKTLRQARGQEKIL